MKTIERSLKPAILAIYAAYSLSAYSSSRANDAPIDSLAMSGKAWSRTKCLRACFWDLPYHSNGIASEKGRIIGPDSPNQPLIDVGVMSGYGIEAYAKISRVPYPMCASARRHCDLTVTVGKQTRKFTFTEGTTKVEGRDALGLTNFLRHADEFTITYIDQRGKQIRLLFPVR